MTDIIAKYRITYPGGISQTKNLIRHEDYQNIIKPKLSEAYYLEKENNFKPTPESEAIKSDLKRRFGAHWFTDKSPIWDARTTGILSLLPQQGGEHKVLIEQL